MAKRRLEYLLLLATVLFFHIILVNYLSFYLLLFFLALPVLSLAALLCSGRKVSVELNGTTGAVGRGEPIPFEMTVDNGGLISSGGVAVKLEIVNQFTQACQEETLFLPGNRGRWEVERNLTSQFCGLLSCRILELRIYDFLGLFYLRKRADTEKGARAFPSAYLTIPVFPRRHALPQFAEILHQREETESLEERYSPNQGGDDPTEILEIRAFRDGDRLSRIHWKLSGKMDEPMVKQYGQPIANRPLILLELNGEQEELDGLLDTAASIGQQLSQEENPYLFQWYDARRQTIVRQEIEGQEELHGAIAALLSGGRRQMHPVVLEDFCNEGPFVGYSKVFYLCAQTGEKEIALLDRSIPGQMLHILQVTSASEQQISPALTASLEGGYTQLHTYTLSEDLARISIW